MAVPRLPDWAIYGAVVAALVLVSVAGREKADAPPAPPTPEGSEGALIGPPAGFDHTVAVDPATGPGAPPTGAAFSVSSTGRWITARRLVAGCKTAVILIGGGQGLEAKVVSPARGDTAVLITAGGAPALPVAPPRDVQAGERGFHVGFPQQQSGELTTRLIGRQVVATPGRSGERTTLTAWALVGRTRGLHGSLAGLIGAPVLDGEGRVVAVTLTESRRHGLIWATSPESLSALAPHNPHEPAPGQTITLENYGRVADGLRRDLRVAPVRCL